MNHKTFVEEQVASIRNRGSVDQQRGCKDSDGYENPLG